MSGWDLAFCTSKKLSGGVGAADPWDHTLRNKTVKHGAHPGLRAGNTDIQYTWS